jgi:twinkle protein
MKLIEKYIGKSKVKMTKDELLEGWLWASDHFTWLYPKEGETDLDSLLRLTDLAGEFDAVSFDPWGEIDSTPYNHLSETEYIKQSLSKVRRFARQRKQAFFIIAHPTKLQKDRDGNYPIPDGYSISGSAHWRNLSDMLFTVNRDDPTKHQATIYVGKVKQKDYGVAPSKVTLDYDWHSGRFKDTFCPTFELPTLEVEESF